MTSLQILLQEIAGPHWPPSDWGEILYLIVHPRPPVTVKFFE
jgi:hypothetical protein